MMKDMHGEEEERRTGTIKVTEEDIETHLKS